MHILLCTLLNADKYEQIKYNLSLIFCFYIETLIFAHSKRKYNEPRYYLCHRYCPGRSYRKHPCFGPEAISITSRIFKPAKAGKLFNDQKPYTLTFGRIYDGEEIIDEVLVSLFRAPHSYTGENSTEITCHGSSYILQQVMQLLIKNGCRMAQPGEYTQRAFLNGKMDLSQAEAVATDCFFICRDPPFGNESNARRF